MSSSQPISLFNPEQQTRQSPTSLIFSALVHVAVVGLVLSGFIYLPRVNDQAYMEHFQLHRIELNRPDPLEKYLGGHSGLYPKTVAKTEPRKSLGAPAPPPSSRKAIAQPQVKQTLIQPEIQQEKVLAQTLPVPAMVLWRPPTIKTPKITPPPPQVANTAELQANIEPPNQEVNVADMAVTSTQFTARIPVVQASTTTPTVLHRPDAAMNIPETASTSSQASNAAVLSVSNLQMNQGTVMLPPTNEIASGASNGNSIGNGAPTDHGVGMGKGGHGDTNDAAGNHGNGQNQASGNGHGQDGKPGAGNSTGAGTDNEAERTYARVSLPKNGQFGVVVVGSTMDEQYPETEQIWHSRLTYSVFLHVGATKNWILQYSLPLKVEGASGGKGNHVDAPWPFFIVRPNLAPGDITGNALMVHGFVNQSGHFDSLAVVFPPKFPETAFVLNALRQWQFRPAKQNGQVAQVEVLLIIPGEFD